MQLLLLSYFQTLPDSALLANATQCHSSNALLCHLRNDNKEGSQTLLYFFFTFFCRLTENLPIPQTPSASQDGHPFVVPMQRCAKRVYIVLLRQGVISRSRPNIMKTSYRPPALTPSELRDFLDRLVSSDWFVWQRTVFARQYRSQGLQPGGIAWWMIEEIVDVSVDARAIEPA